MIADEMPTPINRKPFPLHPISESLLTISLPTMMARSDELAQDRRVKLKSKSMMDVHAECSLRLCR